MNKVMVTGANGFVGGALVRELLANDVQVLALDRPGCCGNIPRQEGVRFIPADISNIFELREVITDRDVDAFYHFAWAGSAGESRADTALQLQNAQWTVDCVRFAKELGCKRFIGAGSIMEKESALGAESQENQLGMGHIYAAGKLVSHCMSKLVAAEIGIEHVWAILTNSYGPGEVSPRFINTTLRKIINREPLRFTSATQNYDFVYITDVAKAFFAIGNYGKPFCEYVIGSSDARPLRTFIEEMQRAVAPGVELSFGNVPFAGIDLPLRYFDAKQTEEHTGFRASTPFAEGIRMTMKWLSETEGNHDTKI